MTAPAGTTGSEVNPSWSRLPEIAAGVVYQPFPLEIMYATLEPEDNQAAVIRLLGEFGHELTVSIEHRENSAGWTPLDDTSMPETDDYLLRARC
jgi:hypothetical protein